MVSSGRRVLGSPECRGGRCSTGETRVDPDQPTVSAELSVSLVLVQSCYGSKSVITTTFVFTLNPDFSGEKSTKKISHSNLILNYYLLGLGCISVV